MSGKAPAVSVVITIVYIFLGGVIFQAIEEPNDEHKRQYWQNKLDLLLNNSDSVACADIRKVIPIILQANAYGVTVSGGNTSTSVANWDYSKSVFFAVTVVSTIGYGNVPLKTWTGRMFCIFYAVAGVPLFMFTLFILGHQEKRFVYFISQKLTCCCKVSQQKVRLLSTFIVSLGGSAVFIFFASAMFSAVEGWHYTDAVYFSYISLLTIGFGDYVAGLTDEEAWYRLLVSMWILFGLSWGTILITICQDIYIDLMEKTRKVAEEVGEKIESSVKAKLEDISHGKSDSPSTGESSSDPGNGRHHHHQHPDIKKVGLLMKEADRGKQETLPSVN